MTYELKDINRYQQPFKTLQLLNIPKRLHQKLGT
jgi:hypothetical protein